MRKLVVFAMAALLVCAAGCGKSSGGARVPIIKGTGKHWTLSKPEDFKYGIINTDVLSTRGMWGRNLLVEGQDYIVIQGINLPADFKDRKDKNEPLVDTYTVNIPEKIEGYTVAVIESSEPSLSEKNSAMVAVTIPETVVFIGSYVFSESAISSVKLPKNLKEMHNNVFGDCINLVSVNIPEGLTEINVSTFTNTAIREITIPDNITTIYYGAFLGCKQLTTVNLPSHPMEYPDSPHFPNYNRGAFSGCDKLSIAMRETIKNSGYSSGF